MFTCCLPLELAAQVELARSVLTELGYREESLWLGLAVASARSCSTAAAEAGLRRTAETVSACGFPAVAQWVTEEVLRRKPVHGCSAADAALSPPTQASIAS